MRVMTSPTTPGVTARGATLVSLLAALGCGSGAATGEAAPKPAVAPAAGVSIGPDAVRAGESWTRERTSTNELTLTPRSGAGRVVKKRHTRSETLEDTVIAVDGETITQLGMHVVKKTKVDVDLLSGAEKSTTDPASGKRYVLTVAAGKVAITRDGGAEVADTAEYNSVVDSAGVTSLGYAVWGRHGLRTVPPRPLTVGEHFPLPSDDVASLPFEHTESDLRIAGLGPDVVEIATSMKGSAASRRLEETAVWRVRTRDGRTLSYEAKGNGASTEETAFGPVDVSSRITTTLRIVYR